MFVVSFATFLVKTQIFQKKTVKICFKLQLQLQNHFDHTTRPFRCGLQNNGQTNAGGRAAHKVELCTVVFFIFECITFRLAMHAIESVSALWKPLHVQTQLESLTVYLF